jgi:Integrase core domain
MVDWAAGRVGLHFIPPGEPWRNRYVESFNSRIRDECLNTNSFWSLVQAGVVIGDWKHDYNHHRRHSALGYQTPDRSPLGSLHGYTGVDHKYRAFPSRQISLRHRASAQSIGAKHCKENCCHDGIRHAV